MNQQEEKLRQEILGDAKRKAERAVKRARRDAEKMLQAVRDKHEETRAERMEAAEREAAEKHRAVTAGIEHAIRKRWLTMREDALDAFFSELLPEIEMHEGVESERSLRELLREAFAAVGAYDAVLRVTSRDREILTDAAVREQLGAALGDAAADVSVEVEEDDAVGGGLILVTRDGRRRFDNTYATRLDRLRGELRSAVCAGFAVDEDTNQDG